MCSCVWYPDHQGVMRAMFDDELQQSINEAFGFGDQYEGGFVYTGDHTMYEGLTVLDKPHIDASGSVSAMMLYNHE